MNVVNVAKALADDTRLRLLMALRHGELCVCQLVALVDLATATVSKHLLVLRNAQIVESRKDGRWMYYRIVDEPDPVIRRAIAWASDGWDVTPTAKQDAKALRALCSQSPEELCRTMKKAGTTSRTSV